MRDKAAEEAILDAAVAAHPRFAASVRDADTPLLRLAALVAEGLDDPAETYVERQVAFLAHLVGRAAGGSTEPEARLDALRRVLAEEEGFQGDTETYDAPHNSFLCRVLEQRRGLPISLGVVYLGVAARSAWPLVGLDFPGHFLLRYRAPDRLLIVDPFHAGVLLGFDHCATLAASVYRGLPASRLQPIVTRALEAEASSVRIVTRMLKNLEASYLRRKDYGAAKNIIEKLLLLDPTAVAELRDMGDVCQRMGNHRQALECFRGYLNAAPLAADREQVLAAVARLQHLLEEDD